MSGAEGVPATPRGPKRQALRRVARPVPDDPRSPMRQKAPRSWRPEAPGTL